MEDSGEIKKKITLLRMIIELQEKTINMLQQKSLLKDLKCGKHEEQMNIDAVRSVNRMYRNMHRFYDYPKKVVEPIKIGKSLLDDKDKIIDETFDSFLKYREAYKILSSFVDNICHKAITKIVPETGRTVSASLTLEEKLACYNESFVSSKSVFDEFESLIYHDLGAAAKEEKMENKTESDQIDEFADVKKSFDEIKSLIRHYDEIMKIEGENRSDELDNEKADIEKMRSIKEFYNKIEFFTCAIEKAEFAYNEMKSALFNVLNTDDF